MARAKSDSDWNILNYVEAIFDYWGRNWYLCEQCGKKMKKRGELHHTKYEGATIYDIQIVCHRCNMLDINIGLV